MRQIRQPNHHRAQNGAEHLRADITGHIAPGKMPDRGHPEGDGRIKVPATDPTNGINRKRHCQSPAGGDDDPAGILAFGLVQDDVRDHAVAESDQQHRPDQFGGKFGHDIRSARKIRTRVIRSRPALSIGFYQRAEKNEDKQWLDPFPERWKPKAGLENFSPIKRRYPTQPLFRSMWRKWLEVAAWTVAFLQ